MPFFPKSDTLLRHYGFLLRIAKNKDEYGSDLLVLNLGNSFLVRLMGDPNLFFYS